MTGAGLTRFRLWAIVACLASLALPALARADASDPLLIYKAPTGSTGVPPGTGFNGPCGLAVGGGNLYVSDYYHHTVDTFTDGPPLGYSTQLTKVDPLDGPCGLAVGAGGLYVNDYHRNVTVFPAGTVIDEAHPTGVAYDPSSNRLYVDDRTFISVYEPDGTPVLDGKGDPLRIGEENLEDGYGLGAEAGRVYVADAGTDTVKVYEPAVNVEEPALSIVGPGSGFVSLIDSAVAVDPSSGKIYVADNQQRGVAEQPEAAIDVFSAAGSYLGQLKYKVVDANPPGLAVDAGGDVYVTSGNTAEASIYVYGPNAETAIALSPTSLPGAPAGGPGGDAAIAAEGSGTVAAGGTGSATSDGSSPSPATAPAKRWRLRRHRRGQASHRLSRRAGVAR